MPKFHGAVGYGDTVEKAPGVYDYVITEISYFGDVVRNTRGLRDDQKVIDDLTVENSISIVANAYANENFINIKYVRWLGKLWVVSNVDVQPPRLLLRLGGVYSGPIAA